MTLILWCQSEEKLIKREHENVISAINMTVRIIILAIIAIATMMISTCSADPHFLSLITKFYDANVKSLRNFFNSNEYQSDASVWLNDNDINDNDNEIDNSYWFNYPRKNDMYEVRCYFCINFI